MDYEEYRNTYFTNPIPQPRYRFSGSFGITLYFEEFEAAVHFHQSEAMAG